MRDELHYTLIIDKTLEVVVIPHKLSGVAKKIVTTLLKNLKPESQF